MRLPPVGEQFRVWVKNIQEPETNSNFESRKEAQIANLKGNEASSKHQFQVSLLI